MTLKEKLEVFEELERGRSLAEVGRLHNVNESTIRGIRKIGDKIRTSIVMKLRVCVYMCAPGILTEGRSGASARNVFLDTAVGLINP